MKAGNAHANLTLMAVLETDEEKTSTYVLGGQHAAKLSSLYSEIGVDQQNVRVCSEETEMMSDWVLREFEVEDVEGKTLSLVTAILHMDKETKEGIMSDISEFSAVLGFVRVAEEAECGLVLHSPNLCNTKNMSWVVEESGQLTQSLTLEWRESLGAKLNPDGLTKENSCYEERWDIFVDWNATSSQVKEDYKYDDLEWIGVAFVPIFRCCKLIVPSSTTRIRFVIQPKCRCGERVDLAKSVVSLLIELPDQ